ncbi:uncharacterized protein (UPF0333 family) [Elusimicrobium simillimum]|uniref:hypothetical protein n=1 Tax=Elusimicrobium simillimum TaxID=3143438 RepID=UPI003C6FB6BE
MVYGKTLKNKKGQAAVEYILVTASLFIMFIMFYVFYTNIVPVQFEQGARVILTVYEPK